MFFSRLNSNVRYLISEALLFLGLSYLFILFSTSDDFLNPNLALIQVILLTVICLGWLWFKKSKPMPLRSAILLYGLVFLITSLFSIDVRRSLGEVYFLLFAIFLFSFFSDLVGHGIKAELVVKVLLLVGAIQASVLWAQVLQWYIGWLQGNPGNWLPTITYRLPVPNLIAFYLNPLILMASARLIYTKAKLSKFILLVYLAALLGLSYLASSRGAWLGMLVGFIFIAWFSAAKWRGILAGYWHKLIHHKAVLVLLVLIMVIMLSGGGWLLYRQTIHPTHGTVANSRTEFWGPAWQTFLNHPILGQGPSTYVTSWVSTYSVPTGMIFPHAHSVPLDLLAEMGIAGLLGFGVLYVATWRRMKINYSQPELVDRSVWIAAGASLAAFTIQGFFDCFHVEPMGLWELLILLGAACGGGLALGPGLWNRIPKLFHGDLREKWENLVKGFEKIKRPWWVLLILLAAWLNLRSLYPFASGVQAGEQGDWATAVRELQDAVAYDPMNSVAQAQLGLANSQMYPGNPEFAILNFENAVKLDPAWGLNHANLGALYLEQGDIPKAREQFQEAVERSFNSSLFYLNLGVTAEVMQDWTAAGAAYQNALNHAYDSSPAYFWRQTDFRKQVYSEWLADQVDQTIPTLEDLQIAVVSQPESAQNYLNLAERYLELNSLDQAEHTLGKAGLAYYANDFEQREWVWLNAKLAAAKGDFNKAVIFGESAVQTYLFQGISDPGYDHDTIIYYQTGFRQPALSVEMVPKLVVNPVTDRWGERMNALGDWYKETGQMEKACEWYSKLLQFSPDNDTVRPYFNEDGICFK
jgi:tetratricopeptide (TPR) repeat protein/O-antigen ligase